MVYTTDTENNVISVRDSYSGKVIKDIPIAKEPYAIDVNSNTNMIYVANGIANRISVINGTTNEVVSNIIIRNISDHIEASIAVDKKTSTIYVSAEGSNSICTIDGNTNQIMIDFSLAKRSYRHVS